MNDKDMPVWKFDKVEMVHIKPFFGNNHIRLHDKCYVTLDCGFFIVHDIGISYNDKFGLTWSHDFGWSRFKLMDSCIENPYVDDVRKLQIMIKNELENKKDKIVSFLKGDRIVSELLIDR